MLASYFWHELLFVMPTNGNQQSKIEENVRSSAGKFIKLCPKHLDMKIRKIIFELCRTAESGTIATAVAKICNILSIKVLRLFENKLKRMKCFVEHSWIHSFVRIADRSSKYFDAED